MSKGMRILLLLIIGILMISYLWWRVVVSQSATEPLFEAERIYQEAIDAPTPFQRNQYLNQTLAIYTKLEEEFRPTHGNGKLYNNLAETFFQLEQYPWAALYFYQAKALSPRNQKIEDRLQETLTKLDINPTKDESIFKKIFFFHEKMSLPERLQVLSGVILILLLLSSIYLWKRYRFLKGLLAASFLLWVIFFSSVIYTKYFEPLEGVLVKAAWLYRDAHTDSAAVQTSPLTEGSKVEVLDVKGDPQWLKIRTKEGLIGFVSSNTIRLIEI